MEENRIDRAKRFSQIWWKSRAKAGVSQEYMALGLGVSKKTIQNWEKGTSSPSFFQGTEWFRLLGLNPMPYYYEFVFPEQMSMDEMALGREVSDEKVSADLALLMNEMPMELKRQLLFLFYGSHGSSPYAIMQMLLAHLQAPMKDRVSHAAAILQDYEIAKEMNELVQPNHIQPRLEYLQNAVQFGKQAALNKQKAYTFGSTSKKD